MKTKINIYKVYVPDDISDNELEKCEIAIMEAEERTTKYFIPATWTAERIDNTDYYLVKRYHN